MKAIMCWINVSLELINIQRGFYRNVNKTESSILIANIGHKAAKPGLSCAFSWVTTLLGKKTLQTGYCNSIVFMLQTYIMYDVP